MENFTGVFILAIILFCGQSNGRIDCDPNKFPILNTNEDPNFRKKESSDLSRALCSQLINKTEQSSRLLLGCIFAHKSYFKIVDADTAAIGKYADFCSTHKGVRGSCSNISNSYRILNKLMYYCWTMNDIAESNKNVFNNDLEITPDDWKNLYDVENIKLSLCFDQISSDNLEVDGSKTIIGTRANLKFKNLQLLKEYKNLLKNEKSYCNCVEILGLNEIFDRYYAKHFRRCQKQDKPKFIEDVCIKSKKKHFWKKEQLQAISDFLTDWGNVMKQNISLQKLTAFLVEAGDLADKRWCSEVSNNINSKWDVSYIWKNADIDGDTDFGKPMVLKIYDGISTIPTDEIKLFDKIKFNVISKAIYYGFSPSLFDEFIKITNGIPLRYYNFPYNKWECRKLIMDVFLDYDRQSKLPCVKHENYQYNAGNIEHLNKHLTLLMKLNRPYGDCSTLAEGIIKVLHVSYTYWCKLDPTHFTNILTSAVNNLNWINLYSVEKCLKFSSDMEKQILENQLLKYPKFPSDLDTTDITNFEEKMFKEIREKIFGTKEIYHYRNKDNVDLKTVVEVLEKLYPLELADLFHIPEDM